MEPSATVAPFLLRPSSLCIGGSSTALGMCCACFPKRGLHMVTWARVWEGDIETNSRKCLFFEAWNMKEWETVSP